MGVILHAHSVHGESYIQCSTNFDQVHNPYRSGDIPVQSHVCLGIFFKNPQKQPDAKVLSEEQYLV